MSEMNVEQYILDNIQRVIPKIRVLFHRYIYDDNFFENLLNTDNINIDFIKNNMIVLNLDQNNIISDVDNTYLYFANYLENYLRREEIKQEFLNNLTQKEIQNIIDDVFLKEEYLPELYDIISSTNLNTYFFNVTQTNNNIIIRL